MAVNLQHSKPKARAIDVDWWCEVGRLATDVGPTLIFRGLAVSAQATREVAPGRGLQSGLTNLQSINNVERRSANIIKQTLFFLKHNELVD